MQLQGVELGALVDFVLVIEKDTGYATNLRVHRQAERPSPALAIGQRVPDFTLTDSTSASVTLSSYAGKIVVINFIYTRCAQAAVLSAHGERICRPAEALQQRSRP